MDGVARSRLLRLVLALSSSPAPASKLIGKKKKKKRVLQLLDDDDGSNDPYECRSCGRRFKTFQALGGHRTSHSRRPPTTKLGKAAAAAEHRCGTCGLVFATGQALGGHMRRHFTHPPAVMVTGGAAAAWSTTHEAMASSCGAVDGGRDEDDAWPRLIHFI